MNCNEEFVIKAIGKISLEYPQLDQLRVRDLLYEALYNYDILPQEKALVASDIEEKMYIFLASKRIEGASPKTLYNYSLIISKFSNMVCKPTGTVNVMDIRMFLASMAQGRKQSTLNAILSCLKSFFGWLEGEEYIPRNPTKKLKQIKLPIRLRGSLNVEELERLRDSCKTVRERALIEFIFSTGCRVGEVYNVNIQDLNFNDNSLKVVGKGDKQREVFFSPKAKLYIQKYLATRTDSTPALFVTSKLPHSRLGIRSIEREINRIATRLEIDKSIYPHLLRHTMATLGLASGAKLTTIQKLLGHSDPSTTQIYAETSMDDIKQEYKQYFIQ